MWPLRGRLKGENHIRIILVDMSDICEDSYIYHISKYFEASLLLFIINPDLTLYQSYKISMQKSQF